MRLIDSDKLINMTDEIEQILNISALKKKLA